MYSASISRSEDAPLRRDFISFFQAPFEFQRVGKVQ